MRNERKSKGFLCWPKYSLASLNQTELVNKDDDTADEFFSIDKNDSKTVLPYVLRVSKSRYGINFPDISFDIRVYTRHQTGEVKRL